MLSLFFMGARCWRRIVTGDAWLVPLGWSPFTYPYSVLHLKHVSYGSKVYWWTIHRYSYLMIVCEIIDPALWLANSPFAVEFDEGHLKDDPVAAQEEINENMAIMDENAQLIDPWENPIRYVFQVCWLWLKQRATPGVSWADRFNLGLRLIEKQNYSNVTRSNTKNTSIK